MKQLQDIKGIIFDYGGTIDTNGKHWAEVLWESYQSIQIPINKEAFRAAYIHGEKTLALKPLIKPSHNFYDVLLIKAQIQIEFLIQEKHLTQSFTTDEYPQKIALNCYNYAKHCTSQALPVINYLSQKYKIVLVSNFYGNIHEV